MQNDVTEIRQELERFIALRKKNSLYWVNFLQFEAGDWITRAKGPSECDCKFQNCIKARNFFAS
jgi:hypothetical protein